MGRVLSSEPHPHNVEWTPRKIARFWGWWGDQMGSQAFFSLTHGPRLLDIAGRSVRFDGARVVDVGCGPGHLLDHLLERGARCSGVEVAETLVAEANARLEGRPCFEGVSQGSVDHLPLPDGIADVACSLEVAEHLLDDQLDAHVAEMRRILRPGGHLVLTTPNREDLRAEHALCPDCGAVFHRIQHVRAWTAESLTAVAGRAGFEPVRVVTTVMAPTRTQVVLNVARRRLRPLVGAPRLPLPQLIYIGRRD